MEQVTTEEKCKHWRRYEDGARILNAEYASDKCNLCEIDRLRAAVEEICQERATSPITRARLRHAIAGVDWRKVK